MSSVDLGNRCAAFNSSWSHGRANGDKAECDVCHHKAFYHRHFNNLWKEVTVESTVTDKEAKKACENAKTDKEKQEVAKNNLEGKLQDIEREINNGQEKVEDLCSKYEGLAISNSFSSYIQATIKLLQQRYEARSKAGAQQDELGRLTNLIGKMQKNYEIATGKKDESQPNVKSVGLAATVAGLRTVFLGITQGR